MFSSVARLALAVCFGAVMAGCSQKQSDGGASKGDASATRPATADAGKANPKASPTAQVNRPGINDTGGTPSGAVSQTPAAPMPPAAKANRTASDVPAAVPPATLPSSGITPPAVESGVNPLFTLPPSKGPAPHKFSQISLNRSGPSGDLEMQLTGDGIYRIRDHGRGNSYSGNGQLTPEQIKQWAEAMKDWDSLKEDYRADPKAKDGDTIEILYGGKRVVASSNGKDNPKVFTDAYKRLLDLNEQSKKEAGVTEAAPEKKDDSK